MVDALLVMAPLLAVALPNVLGVRTSTGDRASKSKLNTALLDARGPFHDDGTSRQGVTSTTPQAVERGMTFATATIDISAPTAPCAGHGRRALRKSTDTSAGSCRSAARMTGAVYPGSRFPS